MSQTRNLDIHKFILSYREAGKVKQDVITGGYHATINRAQKIADMINSEVDVFDESDIDYRVRYPVTVVPPSIIQ